MARRRQAPRPDTARAVVGARHRGRRRPSGVAAATAARRGGPEGHVARGPDRRLGGARPPRHAAGRARPPGRRPRRTVARRSRSLVAGRRSAGVVARTPARRVPAVGDRRQRRGRQLDRAAVAPPPDFDEPVPTERVRHARWARPARRPVGWLSRGARARGVVDRRAGRGGWAHRAAVRRRPLLVGVHGSHRSDHRYAGGSRVHDPGCLVGGDGSRPLPRAVAHARSRRQRARPRRMVRRHGARLHDPRDRPRRGPQRVVVRAAVRGGPILRGRARRGVRDGAGDLATDAGPARGRLSRTPQRCGPARSASRTDHPTWRASAIAARPASRQRALGSRPPSAWRSAPPPSVCVTYLRGRLRRR